MVFPANSPVGTQVCADIQLFQDGVLEDTETFGLDLQEVPGSTIDIGFPPPTNTATGFITDNSGKFWMTFSGGFQEKWCKI